MLASMGELDRVANAGVGTLGEDTVTEEDWVWCAEEAIDATILYVFFRTLNISRKTFFFLISFLLANIMNPFDLHRKMMEEHDRLFSGPSGLFGRSSSLFDDHFGPSLFSRPSQQPPQLNNRQVNEHGYIVDEAETEAPRQNHERTFGSSRSLFGLNPFERLDSHFGADFNVGPRDHAQTSIQTYSYSSNGREPPIIRQSSQSSKTVNGVTELQRKERDETGKEVIAVKRIVGDKARLVEQQRVNGATLQTNETLFNLQERMLFIAFL